jgi:CO/xanthine dehydrogenase FAD-binding subunit
VSSQPVEVPEAAQLLLGRPLTDATLEAAAVRAAAPAKPMDNTDFSLHWRKRMVREMVGYALRDLRGDAMQDVRRRIARHTLDDAF